MCPSIESSIFKLSKTRIARFFRFLSEDNKESHKSSMKEMIVFELAEMGVDFRAMQCAKPRR